MSTHDPLKGAKNDGKRCRAASEKVAKDSIETWNSLEGNPYLSGAFKPNGQMTLAVMVAQSVVSLTGNSAAVAMYPNMNTTDGQPRNGYIIMFSA